MPSDEIRSDRFYTGAVVFGGSVSLPEGTIEDEDIALGANIDPDKMTHRHAIHYGKPNGSDVASETQLLHVARADGEIVSIELRPTTVPTGGDKQYTVDVLKAEDGGSSWTSVLSSVITVDSGETDDTVITAVLDGTPTYEDGDALRVVVTASGSTGSQGQGFVLTITVNEEPS